jgi:branched-chain amino acid transport system substrate-binding protein
VAHSWKRAVLATAGATALFVGAAACGGSSSPGGNTGPTAGGTQTVTIGVLADETGPAASATKTVVDGVKAGTIYAAREGITVRYVVGDTATNPATALTAAQKLVTEDHVQAVLMQSALGFTVSSYLTAHNVPVVGFAEDGHEWFTSPNMFSITGPVLVDEVTTTAGNLFRAQGATNVAVVGYGVSPQSQNNAAEGAASAKLAGLKAGYTNVNFPFGSTDVGPTVLAMKAAGIDALYATVDPNTVLSLVTALRNQGVNLKVALLPTGYGGDLTSAGPGAVHAAQGSYFVLGYEPVEMRTAATRQFVADRQAAGITGDPTFAQYNGYLSVGLLVRAFKAAGANPTSASLLNALRGIHNWDGLGLYGGRTYDINQKAVTAGDCLYITKLVGSTFQLVKGADPICGTLTANKIKPAGS